MTPAAPRICIVTPSYISSTPRVVREADALTAAGYDVRVAFTQGQLETVRRFDRELLEQKPWRSSVFRWSDSCSDERWAYHRTRLRHHVARALPSNLWGIGGVIERAESRIYPELADLAAAERADLYIGHYPDGLAAACQAARRHGSRVGYDVEDLYADVFEDTRETKKMRARILGLEHRYVPQCAYVSAVSAPVAAVFAERFNREVPVVIHNCHSWAERQTLDGLTNQRRGAGLSLYWFSQTVGLNRGIQDAIRAAGVLKPAPQIHLQGAVADDVRRDLVALAVECGIESSLYFHGPVPPHELISRAAEHDVGLALETDAILNRRLAVTNKQFLYLVAGLAIAASDIPGQRSVMESCLSAGVLYPPGDFRALAAHFDVWRRDPARLAAARRAALDAAQTTWNWERESRLIVDAVSRVVPLQALLAG